MSVKKGMTVYFASYDGVVQNDLNDGILYSTLNELKEEDNGEQEEILELQVIRVLKKTIDYKE